MEVSIDVIYEPSKLGDVRTNLILSSPQGGDFVCPLFGHCIAPRPQGPILVKLGSSSQVAFKNVFNNEASFTFVVDNSAFTVKATEKISAKKTIMMNIGYSVGVSQDFERTDTPKKIKSAKAEKKSAVDLSSKVGKLVVTHVGTGVNWVFYLKGALA